MWQHDMVGKKLWGPPLLIIHSFYGQKVSMTLQKVQATAILHRVVVTIKKTSSKLVVLSIFSPISLHDLFRVTGDGFRS
jgi:hypothetical protein